MSGEWKKKVGKRDDFLNDVYEAMRALMEKEYDGAKSFRLAIQGQQRLDHTSIADAEDGDDLKFQTESIGVHILPAEGHEADFTSTGFSVFKDELKPFMDILEKHASENGVTITYPDDTGKAELSFAISYDMGSKKKFASMLNGALEQDGIDGLCVDPDKVTLERA